MADYQIFMDATADCSTELLHRYPSVKNIPMQVEIGGRSYLYGPGGDITVEQFYALQKQGNYATTSQITPQAYRDTFEPVLKEGKDLLYVCFTSGLSGSYQSAQLAVNELKELYPQRKIYCIDSLCASVGGGFLVCETARKQAEGMSIDDLAQWVISHRLLVCHWFTVDVFDHLRHGGRVSAATAVAGTVLQIKPLLHVDKQGKLESTENARGRKKAMKAQFSKMEQGWRPDISRLVFIGHGDNPEGAAQLKKWFWIASMTRISTRQISAR